MQEYWFVGLMAILVLAPCILLWAHKAPPGRTMAVLPVRTQP